MVDAASEPTLRQLEYLATVVELGSVRGAADLLHVTQPTVSHQLAELERRVGTPLLRRSGRGVRPTEAGRSLARTGRQVLELGRTGVALARQLGSGGRREITIGAVASLASSVLPAAIASYREGSPGTSVRVREFLRRDDLSEATRRGEVDVAIGGAPAGWLGPVRPLGVEQYVLVVPPGSPHLGRDEPLDLAELADQPWVLYDADHGLHDVVSAACAAAGFAPEPAVRTRQIDTAVRLAAAGLGPALVPDVSVPREHRPLVVLPLPAVRRAVDGYGVEAPGPEVEAFLALLTPARTGLQPS